MAKPERHPAVLERVVVKEGKKPASALQRRGACLARRCFGGAAGDKICAALSTGAAVWEEKKHEW